MRGLTFIFNIALLFALPGEGWAQTNWQREWERVVASAEKEGQVRIAGPRGDNFRIALGEMFQKKYSKIKVEYVGASSDEQIARIARERQANTFNWDVYIGRSLSALPVLRPTGAFEPLKPELVLPDAVDDSKWSGGFHTGFVDAEEKLYYAFDSSAVEPAYVNLDLVSATELKSLKELLNPQWAGKIGWADPRYEGGGLNTAVLIFLSYGEEFLRKLFREQKIVFTLDRRQLTDWVVRGRYPIGVSLSSSELKRFQDQGAGKNVKVVDDPSLVSGYNPSGMVGILNRRPHPNATRVYVNWLLSKEGQTSWTGVGRNSRRLDVPAGNPSDALQPNKKYIQIETEKMNPQLWAVMKLARETIPQ